MGIADGPVQATFTPHLDKHGCYLVQEWHPVIQDSASASMAQSVPLLVDHKTGQAKFSINQQQDGGQWNTLDYLDLNAGSQRLVLSQPVSAASCLSSTPKDKCFWVVDALRLVH